MFINKASKKLAQQAEKDSSRGPDGPHLTADQVPKAPEVDDMSTLSRKLQLTEWKGKWSMNVTPDNQVTFLSASRQVFSTTSALLMSDEDVKAQKLDETPPPQLVS